MIVLKLGGANMGENVTETDLDNWTDFVAQNADDFGVPVTVYMGALDGEDTVEGASDSEEEDHVRQVVNDLWSSWCAEGAKAS